MPITYTRSSLPRPSHLANVSDLDSSIVLSDLVRSGEVSRLRRRGAIAIRDIPAPQSSVQPPLTIPPPPPATSETTSRPYTAQRHPEPDLSETDDDDVEQRQRGVGRWFFRSRLNSRELSSDFNDPDPLFFPQEADVRPEDEDEDSSYVLFCGGRLREGDWHASPPAAPQSPDTPVRHRASAFRPHPAARRPSHSRARRTNGCGVLIHLNAQPRRRQGTWVACGTAAETVVRMDSRYFDCASIKMIRSACGCVREGVGCRACGNPLGMIYVPCQAAADGLNIPRASSSSSASTPTGRTQLMQSDSLMHPPGLDYWLPSIDTCQRRQQASTAEIFNFFSERVRSAPEFTFPPPPSPSSEAPPSRPMQPLLPWALATPPQRVSVSSIPESFAYRQWTDRFSTPSVDNIQASDSPLDSRPGEVVPNDGDTLLEEETEGDNAEKPDDSGITGGDPILWAER